MCTNTHPRSGNELRGCNWRHRPLVTDDVFHQIAEDQSD